MSTECPKCGSRYLRPSRIRNFSEKLGRFRLVSPLRCVDCNTRFIASTFVWRDLFFAHCPICRRMDLNGWSGKTYTPPFFWVGFMTALGALKWRCEYCRINFASFRRRKEVFTFKRWKKFVPVAEDLKPEGEPTTGEGEPGTKTKSRGAS
jgi:hypothetical protein